MNYDEPVDLTSGDLMSVEDFRDAVESEMFIDYDGHGNPVKDGMLMNKIICPSRIHELPADATHVLWYNR